jgi:hypothetical protein
VDGDWAVSEQYDELLYAYDTGAQAFSSLRVSWRPWDALMLFGEAAYASERKFYRLSDQETVTCPETVLVDAGMVLTGPFLAGMELSLTVKNLFDRTVRVPGTHAVFESRPFSVALVLCRRW